MQTRNPILDEFAKLTTGAMGLAQAAGEEAKSAWRAQTDRLPPTWTWCAATNWTP